MKKAFKWLGAILLFSGMFAVGHACSFAYFSAMQVSDNYKQYGSKYAFLHYAEDTLELSDLLSLYYHAGAYHWAEARFDLEQTTQTSSLRLIHALSLLNNAKMYSAEEVTQAPHIRDMIERGYISSLASEVMEHSDIRRCNAAKAEQIIRKSAFTNSITLLYEKILIQIADKERIESLWQKALEIEERNTDRALLVHACFDTDDQFNALISMGAKKITFKSPKTGHSFPFLIAQTFPKCLPWTMDDATWNAARREIRAEAHARWAQRFADSKK